MPNVEDVKDYYAELDLNEQERTKVLYDEIGQIAKEASRKLNGGALNSPELMEEFRETKAMAMEARPKFFNDNKRSVYDSLLRIARKTGRVIIKRRAKARTMPDDFYQRLNAMFAMDNYQSVIQACIDAISKDVHDYRVYSMLSLSYYYLNDYNNSLKAAEEGLSFNKDNLELLRAAVRASNVGGQSGYNKAQEYINRMMGIDPESPITNSEQVNLYLTAGKEDMAFQTIDAYVEKHPNNQQFRQETAYNLMAHCEAFYTVLPEGNAMVIASRKDYEKCLETCQKAAGLYNDEAVRGMLNDIKSFGQIEYNRDNIEYIVWLVIGGAIYIVAVPISLLLFFSAWRLHCVSKRPYWQIYQYELTGKREPSEGKYILIGKIFTGYLKIGFKIAWGIVKFIFGFMLRG